MGRTPLGSTMRVVQPAPNVLAFYDGRVEGVRAWSDEPNWLDDGAYALGACSYAIIDRTEALVYDTHISLAHAAIIRGTLENAGVTSIRVVLSHWHDDHVAGNAAFQDCEILSNGATAQILGEQRAAIESGTPPIRPLVLPTRTFEGSQSLQIGSVLVELHCFDIHSRDGTVMLLPETGILFAGDTLEDPITYVAEPDRLGHHLVDLERLSRLSFDHILPNHGSLTVIAEGGYGRGLLEATRRYVEKLRRVRDEPDLRRQDLRAFIGEDLTADNIRYFAPYEAVHQRNLARVAATETS